MWWEKQEEALPNFNCRGKVEIITGTLGKAIGGIGGFATGEKRNIDMLRQRSRPYLFSNSIPPLVAAAGSKMIDIMSETNELQDKLHENTVFYYQNENAGLILNLLNPLFVPLCFTTPNCRKLWHLNFKTKVFMLPVLLSGCTERPNKNPCSTFCGS